MSNGKACWYCVASDYLRATRIGSTFDRLHVIISFTFPSAAVLKLYYNKLSEVGG